MEKSRWEWFLAAFFALLGGMALVLSVLFPVWKLPVLPACLFLLGALAICLGGQSSFTVVKTAVQKRE